MRARHDGGDTVAGIHAEFLQYGRSAVTALKEFMVGEAALTILHGFTVSIQAPRTAGEVEGRKRRFHGERTRRLAEIGGERREKSGHLNVPFKTQ